MEIIDRLDKIDEKIRKKDFMENKGLGNEVGYYVFDYDAEDELIVRNYLDKYIKNFNDQMHDISIKSFDLYDIFIDYIDNEGFLETIYEMEEEDGFDYVQDVLTDLFQMDSDEDNYIVNYIIENTPEDCVVFISGIGKIYPFIRSHIILNKLHLVFDRVPVVLFYPGRYDGNTLILFSEFEDNNYYRAFPLVVR